ncbi:MAG: hypothetical protein Fur0041_01100 [Bacteroidia bacterium]
MFIACAAFAQDKIQLKNGNQVTAVVLEVSPDYVKYKRYENQSGPTYSIPKSEVIRITYQNGQTDEMNPVSKVPASNPVEQRLRYGGPRIGVTYLGPGESNNKMNDLFDRNINPVISQFGWQFETRFFTLDNGAQGLVEFVPLIGGLEQGIFIPSASALVGFRTPKGYEVGVGPIISLGGPGIVFAAGTSFRSGKIVFPVNLAFVPSVTKSYPESTEVIYNPQTNMNETHVIPAYKEHTGFRLTLTIGFNSRSN